MPNLPVGISSMKLKVSTFEQEISSASLGNNSIQITDSNIISAFNNSPAGTIFNPSIAVTYSDTAFPSVSEILTPTVIPNYVPKKITPSIYLEDIPNKLTTDIYFTIVPSITDRGTGLLSYSSSHESVANVDASGVVTIFGAGTATITVSLAASADQVYAAASVSKSFTVNKAIPQLSLLSSTALTKLTTDAPFTVAELVTKEGTGALSYQITHVSVATVTGGVVTINGAGTTTITVSLPPSLDGKWAAATPVSISLTVSLPGPTWTQRGADIDGEAAGDESGHSVSLSADGSIVAIGAKNNDGNGYFNGHVRVYAWNSSSWVQRGADIDGEELFNFSGLSVSLSADGSIVAIGAISNSGNGSNSGHVRVYQYNATKTTAQMDQSLPNFGPIGWNRLGNDIDGEAYSDYSGQSISLSADGSIVAIGATGNDGNGTDSGHVRVYAYDGTSSSWVQRGADIDGEAADDYSGLSVSLSADGYTVVIGSTYNNNNRGHVRVYAWNGSSWVQRGADIDGEAADDYSGYSVSLSADGSIVAIGASYNDDNGSNSGHVRVYAWNVGSSIWDKRGADIDGEAADDYSGRSVSLSADGSIVAIGAPYNDGNDSNSGHVRVYEYK